MGGRFFRSNWVESHFQKKFTTNIFISTTVASWSCVSWYTKKNKRLQKKNHRSALHAYHIVQFIKFTLHSSFYLVHFLQWFHAVIITWFQIYSLYSNFDCLVQLGLLTQMDKDNLFFQKLFKNKPKFKISKICSTVTFIASILWSRFRHSFNIAIFVNSYPNEVCSAFISNNQTACRSRHPHTRTHTSTYTYIHVHTRTNTNTYTHTHKHTVAQRRGSVTLYQKSWIVLKKLDLQIF